MKTRLVSLALAVAALGVLAWSVMAQAPPATADMRPVVESYYKIAPGKTDEWLEIYRTHHLPVLQELRREGRLADIIIYRPFLHQGGPPWDFKVILRWRDFTAMGDRAHEEEVEHRLFTAWLPHRDAESHRWELTEKHWDDIMVVVPE
ncbi:MAG: hypothetical protein ACRD35_10100 [Candidatus Acidiferrales bacterium]